MTVLNVYYCRDCLIALVDEEECSKCKNKMDTIGWMENVRETKEKVNETK